MSTKFARGAHPSPRHKLVSTPKHVTRVSVPVQFPSVLDQAIVALLLMWGNDDDGDCCTAEEFFKLLWAIPNVQGSDAEAVAWATKYGYLNGATLTDVMDTAISQGITIGSVNYKDGPYTAVDWTNRANLCSALSVGPVKLGVASAQFDNVANVGVSNGWFMTGFTEDANEDHDPSLFGYGTLAQLFALFNLPVPAGADPTAFGYLLFTWSTIGVIDESSMLAITGEAWVRTPPTAGFGPTPVPPSPPSPPSPPTPVPPTPVPPTPPPALFSGTVTYVNGAVAAFNPGSISLKDELSQKGISLTVFGDLVQLFKDIQSKAGLATIMVDVEKLATDILGSGAKR